MSSPTVRRTRLERLEAFLRKTWLLRRVLFYGSVAFPSFVGLILTFLALYPMLFAPGENLSGTLAALVAGGLSFSSVAYSASKSRRDDELWSLRMAMAGTALFRFSIAMAMALALNVLRERLLAAGGGEGLDLALRLLMVLVTAAGIAIAFLGFQLMVMLFGPSFDERTADRLRRIEAAVGEVDQATSGPSP